VDGSAAAFCATARAIDAGEFLCTHRHQPHRILPRFWRALGEDLGKPTGIHSHEVFFGAPSEAGFNGSFNELR
jgi:hypothetical protein